MSKRTFEDWVKHDLSADSLHIMDVKVLVILLKYIRTAHL